MLAWKELQIYVGAIALLPKHTITKPSIMLVDETINVYFVFEGLYMQIWYMTYIWRLDTQQF